MNMRRHDRHEKKYEGKYKNLERFGHESKSLYFLKS